MRYIPAPDLVAPLAVVLVPFLMLACDPGSTTGPDPDPDPDPDPPPSAAQIEVVSGDSQFGAVNHVLRDSLVLRALDGNGQPVAGIAVTLAAASGGGSIDPASATTDADGMIRAAWTLGDQPGQQQASATADAASATLSAEAISLSVCGSISTDRTLLNVGHPFVLCGSGASVTGGAVLQIEPGVTMLAESTALLRVRTDGAIRAVGTESDTIRIVGHVEAAGSWHGIWLESDAEENELAWVEIAHGGGSSYSNLFLSSSAAIRISDSVFRDSDDWGIHVSTAAATLPSFQRNTFRSNGLSGMRIRVEQMRFLDGESVFEDNGRDLIEVREGTLSGEPHLIPNPGVPYRLSWWSISTEVEIEAGTIFMMEDRHDANVRVRTDGTLRAAGTEDARILFVGEQPEAGLWGGLWIESGFENVLDHVEIAHGGRGDLSNLFLSGSARVSVTNSVFRDGSDYGVAVASSSVTLAEFSDNEIRGNEGRAMRAYPVHMTSLDGSTSISFNDEDVIELRNGSISGAPQTWRATDAPYLMLAGIDISTAVIVQPGFRLQAEDGAGTIRVRQGGSLNAVGTPLSMIRFTARSGQAGAWSGL